MIKRRGSDKTLTLHLRGAVRLESDGKPLRVRRKGLALLCYLALEGPSRREFLAELLWGHRSSANNLRVEVHRLRETFAQLGLELFDSGADPLGLPDYLAIEAGGLGELLAGLEDVTEGFQDWLERQRLKAAIPTDVVPLREALLDDVVAQMRIPFVLILKAQPGGSAALFAQGLAARLKLPFIEGSGGRGGALHFLAAPLQHLGGLPEQIARDQEGVWVLERSSFGEDPQLLLALRGSVGAERMRYLTLGPLGWHEAQRFLAALPFREAAALYLASGAHDGYLRELVALRPAAGFAGALPVPQRLRAAYLLEARRLSMEARLAVERLSVHPGAFCDELLASLEVLPYLDELERRGWFILLDGYWHFKDDTARRMLYSNLQRGRQQRYHDRIARIAAHSGWQTTASFHRFMGREEVDWQELLEHHGGWAKKSLAGRLGLRSTGPIPPRTLLAARHELTLLETERFGSGIRSQGEHLQLIRLPGQLDPSAIEWQLPDGVCLLNVKGRVYVDNSLGIGVSGGALPLELVFSGAQTVTVKLAAGVMAQQTNEGELLLPLPERFDYWFYSESEALRLESFAEAGVLELSVSAHKPSFAGRQTSLRAFDLAALAATEQRQAV